MKLSLIFNDTEYMRALAEGIGRSDNNVIVEMGGMNTPVELDLNRIILTDAEPESLGDDVISRCDGRIVFFCDAPDKELDSPRVVFKYRTLSRIMTAVKEVASVDAASRGISIHASELYGVCCDGNNMHAMELGHKLAKQLIYRTGEHVALIPLVPVIVNRQKDDFEGSVRRVLYLLENRRRIPKELLLRDDEMGVSTVRLPAGPNALVTMGEELLARLILKLEELGYRRIVIVVGDSACTLFRDMLQISSMVLWLDEAGSSDIARTIIEDDRLHIYESGRADAPADVWIDNLVAARGEEWHQAER